MAAGSSSCSHTRRAPCAKFYERDAQTLRYGALATVCATGVILLGRGEAEAMQRDAAAFLAAGPPPLGDAELARRRYVLTDAVDDLMGARDGDERAVVAAQVLVAVAELALIVDGCWLGAGKWLLRKLRAARAPRPPAGCSTRIAGRSATVTRRRSARWPRRCWPTPAGASARATDRPRHVAEPVHRASRAARR
jgi:hypothetical protein